MNKYLIAVLKKEKLKYREVEFLAQTHGETVGGTGESRKWRLKYLV